MPCNFVQEISDPKTVAENAEKHGDFDNCGGDDDETTVTSECRSPPTPSSSSLTAPQQQVSTTSNAARSASVVVGEKALAAEGNTERYCPEPLNKQMTSRTANKKQPLGDAAASVFNAEPPPVRTCFCGCVSITFFKKQTVTNFVKLAFVQ